MPYTFFINDTEIMGDLKSVIEELKCSKEETIAIVYQVCTSPNIHTTTHTYYVAHTHIVSFLVFSQLHCSLKPFSE